MESITMGMRRVLTGVVITCAVLGAAGAGAQVPEREVGRDARKAVSLTVYGQNLAMIDEVRGIDLTAGNNRLALVDVGTGLRPETLILGGADLRVLEQVYDFDLLTPQRLLEAAVGQEVRVVRRHPQSGEETVFDAELLSIASGPVLRIGDRIETAEPGRIVFNALPPGLRVRPTVVVEIESARAGPRDLALRYLTGGLSWQADYVASLDASGTRMDLTGLITLTNNSGAEFENAKLRLVAGEVNQTGQGSAKVLRGAVAMESMAANFADMPAQQAASDRYLYSYDRPVDLADREAKQLTLFRAPSVTATRRYRFTELINAHQGAGEIGPVQAAIVLEVENTEAAGLGRPLPGGTIRVYEAAAGGALFAGEDRIGHTAEGETLELTLGRAFDLTGESRHTAFERISNRSYEIAQEITLRNAKDEAVEVRVIGEMPPGWKILSESLPHEAETAHRIAWTVTIPAEGEASFQYRARISR